MAAIAAGAVLNTLGLYRGSVLFFLNREKECARPCPNRYLPPSPIY